MNVGFRSPELLPSVWSMKRIMIGGAVLIAALALGGCSAGGGASDSLAPATEYDSGWSLPSEGSEAAQDGAVADRDASGAIVDRSVIVTGSVTVTVEDPLDSAREAVRIVESAGGRVDARQELSPTDFQGGSARLTLRIPAERLTATLEELRELGRADSVTLSSNDVTVERQDVEARISALRSTIASFQSLMARATDIDDLITLENELSHRQADLESLEAQQRYLGDQVSMSTIALELRSEATAPSTQPDTFLEGLEAGWGAFVAFWAGLLVVLGVLAPWLVLLALIAAAVVVLVRVLGRRSGTSSPPE